MKRQKNQSFSVPEKSILGSVFLYVDILDSCKVPSIIVGLISFDQEKTFNHVDHKYLYNVIKTCPGIRYVSI